MRTHTHINNTHVDINTHYDRRYIYMQFAMYKCFSGNKINKYYDDLFYCLSEYPGLLEHFDHSLAMLHPVWFTDILTQSGKICLIICNKL